MERHSISSWSQEMQPPKVREAKTAIQKPLCRLCECPTSDGHVLASQVDRFKLRKWAMKIMNLTERDENLPEVVKEDDLICYFCIWQAEIGDESGDEAVAWWPKNLDLEENARVLRENYSVGEVEQCWVQLEEVVDLAKYEKEIPKKRSGECFYCGKRYCNLRQHVKLMHKKAIKCGIRGCTAYFNTEKDKKRHMQHHLHEKYNETCGSKNFWCKFCEILTFYSKVTSWRQHMNYKHPELVACTHYGCKEYFKSKSEMIQHINSCHKQAINRYLFHCKYCEYFTTLKDSLRKHEEAKHMPKMFKCDLCDASFGSKDRMQLRRRQGKPAIQKPLCRLCECPTADGHVLASQVDRFKLRNWAMKVMNLTERDENLPEVVEEDALICYFCIWQAEFGDESGDEAVAWWPKNLDLEENAKVLRENYSVGDVEQCWVQLEEVDLAKYEKEIPTTWKPMSGVCFYCGKRYNRLMYHVKLMHKEAIKCGIRGCTTFFHTEEEKEQHMQRHLHKKRDQPCESKNFRCKFCEDGNLSLRSEVMKLGAKERKTAIQKPLCRLCECPTSDGHVLASQVDRFKLRKWAMKVMNLTERDQNLPDVVEKDALICYFCIWQAEFGDESGDEAVAWWPKNLDLEENAKVLRENYSSWRCRAVLGAVGRGR
ncbi:Hypothetical predicted protein [Cloeon dipterum]|uniref:C2H2-type domain-containing protein n=1 Tax=Cloeon dipterum TaxID=197152 RepID=A0A8S1D3X6_9INSE|nr:Hypothetical predicted protein [Cloeon dipterum]